MDDSRCIGAGIANEVIAIAMIAGMSTVFVARAVDQVPSSQLWIRLDVANQIPEAPNRRCRDLQCGWRVDRNCQRESWSCGLGRFAQEKQKSRVAKRQRKNSKKSRQMAQSTMPAATAQKATEVQNKGVPHTPVSDGEV